MTHIYCVEDDPSIRELVCYTLNASGFSAEGFEYANNFFAQVEKNLPDLVLLDLMLPDTDGMEILRRLRSNAATEKIPVIIISAKGNRLDKIKGLDTGADDYITKPFDILELLSRIKAVLRRSGSSSHSHSTVSCKDILLDTSSHKAFVNEKEITLTYKEYELLKTLLNHKDIVMSRGELLNKVWGINFEGETRTVDVHVRTLRQKLGSAGKHIETVRNVGYRVTDNV